MKDVKMLTDFSGSDEKQQWRIVNDGVMGGLSQGRIDIMPGGAVFRGQLSLENRGGFTSVRRAAPSYDLDGYTGIRLRVKGDGRTYQFRLRIDDRFDGIAYRSEFETTAGQWLTIDIPFKSFKPTWRGRNVPGAPKLEPGNIKQIGFLLADKKPGDFSLEIEWIQAY